MCAIVAEDRKDAEMVLVPRRPTKRMIEAARYDALAEDAAAVWETMIQEWLTSIGNSPSGSG